MIFRHIFNYKTEQGIPYTPSIFYCKKFNSSYFL